MEEPIVVNKGDETLDLPSGFRFHPTDEEIITYYLTNKVLNTSFSAIAIGEADFNKCEPWDLPKKAKMGEKDCYFFYQRDRKYPTGTRTNRATQSGYWKATGKDREIHRGKTDNLVGMKKTLVFYLGRAPKGEKTNWVMHEFRLEGKFASHNLPKAVKDEWVVSRVFHKNSTTDVVKKTPFSGLVRMNSISMEDHDLFDFSSLPPLVDPSSYNGCSYTTNTPNSRNIDVNDFKSINMFKDPTLIINNINQHQVLQIKPENHSSYEINPIINNYARTNQGDSNYQMGIQNTGSGGSYFFQQNIVSDCYYKQCNNNIMEQQQFSTNQSMVSVSQDTCLSINDRNTDTSSVVSKLDNMGRNNNSTLYEEHEGPSSSVAPQLSDLECLWEDF